MFNQLTSKDIKVIEALHDPQKRDAIFTLLLQYDQSLLGLLQLEGWESNGAIGSRKVNISKSKQSEITDSKTDQTLTE